MITRRTFRSMGSLRRSSRRPFLRGNYQRRGLHDIDWSTIAQSGIAAGIGIGTALIAKKIAGTPVYAQPQYYAPAVSAVPSASLLPTSISPTLLLGGLGVLAIALVASR